MSNLLKRLLIAGRVPYNALKLMLSSLIVGAIDVAKEPLKLFPDR